MRVWDHSCWSMIPSSTLSDLYREPSDMRMAMHWIWRLHVHSSVPLPLKDDLGSPPYENFNQDSDIYIPVSCLICSLDDKFTGHAILSYPRTRLIWKLARRWPWNEDDGSWLSSFLDMLRQYSTEYDCYYACIIYQIRLSRNIMIFKIDHSGHIKFFKELHSWWRSITTLTLLRPLRSRIYRASMLPWQRLQGPSMFPGSPFL